MTDETLPGGSQAIARIDGTKIRAIREGKELTQLYVATAVGVTTDTISRWENRRYPTIKQDNAQKLAEVLEVELAEILDTETLATAAVEEEPAAIPLPEVANRGIPVKMAVLLLIVLVGVATALILKPAKITDSPAPVHITAKRVLPPHVAPGQSFPVIVKIDISPAGNYSMIVRETVPLDCLVVKGLPAFANLDNQNGVLKWIGRAVGQRSFSYLAKAKNTLATDKRLLFSGSVTLKNEGESRRLAIAGDEAVAVKRLHWADANGDYRIDDEEILAVYDQMEAMTSLGDDAFQSGVEDIWAANGYRWDENTDDFALIP